MTTPRVPTRQYRSLRARLRIRHLFECEVCGYSVAGYRTGLEAWMGAEKHRVWNRWAAEVLHTWSRL